VSDVKRLARWSGWCDPCGTERPLVLTETGERGLRAWLHGIGYEDRALTLTCAVCGEWQTVDHDEEDLVDEATPAVAAVPPAPLPVGSPVAAVRPFGTSQVVLWTPPARPYPVVVPRPRSFAAAPDTALELVAEGYDLISAAS
jgi:hypothetical protein